MKALLFFYLPGLVLCMAQVHQQSHKLTRPAFFRVGTQFNLRAQGSPRSTPKQIKVTLYPPVGEVVIMTFQTGVAFLMVTHSRRRGDYQKFQWCIANPT